MHKLTSVRFLASFSLVLILTLMPLFTQDTYLLGVFVLIFFNIILTATFRQIWNIGYLNIANISFLGFGAYTSGLLAIKLGLNFWACLLFAGIVTGLLALLIGYVTLRVKGFYFVMMTVALVESIRMTIMASPREWMGGATGLTNIPVPDSIVIPGLVTIGFDSRANFYYLVLGAMVIFLVALYSIESSRFGMTLRAIKQADVLAEHVGINTMRYKIVGFVFALTIVGLTGSLYAHYYSFIAPAELGFMGTSWSIIYGVIGGWGSIAGPIIGASLITALSELLRPFKQYLPIPLGVVLIFMLLFMPEGIIGLPTRISRLARRALKSR